jgi:neutral ceramidase
MLENNTHVTGGEYPEPTACNQVLIQIPDNKGVSSYLFEEAMKSDQSAAPGFVAAFSQSSVGDTSPNVLGTWCDTTGEQCDFEHSTCGGTTEDCHGHGPEYQKLDLGVASCYEIGRRVYAGAKTLYVNISESSLF